MEQKGIPLSLSPDDFPFRHAINRETIHEEFHFVLPKERMLEHVRTLGDYSHKNICHVYVAVLTFMAEACTNALKYRGDLRPDELMCDRNGDYASRITPIFTYIPKCTHTEEGNPLSPEQLLDDSNIAAYMVSILVRDEQLKLSYAIADQIDINKWGPPSFRKKGEGDDMITVQVRPGPPQQVGGVLQEDNNVPYLGPNAFNDDNVDDDDDGEESESEVQDMNVDVEAIPAGNRNNIDADTYRSLDVYSSRYWFPKRHGVESIAEFKLKKAKKSKSKKFYGAHQIELHRKISSTFDYIQWFCMLVGHQNVRGYELSRYKGLTSSHSVATIREDSPLHPKNCFSLAAAVSQLEALGAVPSFCHVRNWSDLEGNFVVPEQLELHVAAQLRICDFNAKSLFNNCLPHCQIMDEFIIQPVDANNVGEMVVLNDGEEVNVDNVFAAKGIVLEHDRVEKLQSENEFFDVWQQYFDKYLETEIALQKAVQAAGSHPLPPELLTRIQRFRAQGFKHFAGVNYVTNPKLPDGNRAILLWLIKKGDIQVPVLHLFEPLGPETQSAFSQWRANEIMFAESVLKVVDFMVLLFPKLLLAASMVWLPFMHGATNKEHIHFIGPPASLKSDTLNRIESVLIDGTWIPKSGGSKKGILGPHRSQRVIEIYHELNKILAPSTDPRGADLEITEMKLTQLSEGFFIYDTSIEDPKTNERIDVRKVSHYTNVVFGAKNPTSGRIMMSRDGAGPAMLDRSTRIKIIPTATPGRQTIAERVFQSFISAGKSAKMPREVFQVIQLAVSDYCCLMSCYAVPLPNIELFSHVAPNAIGYLSTMHPELANRLRDIGRIKTRLYGEILNDMARYAVCSAIGLAGRVLRDGVPYVYNREEVVNEMSKYAYTDYEKMVFVLSNSVYNMSEGEYNSIAATFILETTKYLPIGVGTEATEPEAHFTWPEPIDLDEPVDGVEAARRANQINNVTLWPLERVLAEVLNEGKNFLGMPKINRQTGQRSDQKFIMREHTRASYAFCDEDNPYLPDDEENLDLDLFSVVSGITNQNPEPPRLERNYVCDHLFKVETIGAGNEYINFNYVRIDGTPDTYANSFSDNVGNRVMSPETIKDIIYTLKRTKIIVPYIPVVPKGNSLVMQHPGYIQSLRHSYSAICQFKLYNVPVVIEDTNRFYMLAQYAETNPITVIEKMVESMCYAATRETRTVIGVPGKESRIIDFHSVHIRPRPNVTLTVARKTNLTEEQFERLTKQFNMSEADVDGYGEETTYKDVDIEEEIALKAILYAHPNMTREQAENYTPRGIWDKFYGEQGVYRPGNPYTLATVAPAAQPNKRKNNAPPRNRKRRSNNPSVKPINRGIPGLDMGPPSLNAAFEIDEFID